MPDIKSLTNNSSSSANDATLPKFNLLENQSELNLLAIGTSNGFVHLYVFGTLPLASIDFNNYLGESCVISEMHFSHHFDKMYVTTHTASNLLKVVIVDTVLLKSHGKELYSIASKYEQLKSHIDYLSSTITTIKETWENILLEMDTKLARYATKVPKGGITADFLDLLMFGTYSNDIEEFLVHDLTKKGLEKFGKTIEMSYGSIQKLLLKYVAKIGQNITYHLAELRGLARLKHRYKILGLDEESINDAIQSNGAFLIKTGEMQQIINHSIVSYKAFFRWLYTSVMHLIDIALPPDIPKMTQQDQTSIAEFLKNFDRIGVDDGTNREFVMEKLGQYLADAPLATERDMSSNEWCLFLKQNQCVAKNPLILKRFQQMSLIQQLDHLKQSIDLIFSKPKEAVMGHFKIIDALTCFNLPNNIRLSQINSENNKTYFAFLCGTSPCEVMCLLETENLLKTRCVYFYFSQNQTKCDIIDLSFYSAKFLTVLIQYDATSVLCQLPLAALIEKLFDVDSKLSIGEQNVPKVNACEIAAPLKNIDGMVASQIAVSGSRSVCIVLADNKRQVRIYEMEAEEEEEEDADMSSTTVRDSDMSVLESSFTD